MSPSREEVLNCPKGSFASLLLAHFLYFRCGVLSTSNTTTFTFDMSDGAVNLTDSLLLSTATHRCGDGSMQCPHCWVISETVTAPVSLYLRSCHAPVRVKGSEGISSHSVCGYNNSVPKEVVEKCRNCKDRSSDDCKTCIDNRVRCFEDCDGCQGEDCVNPNCIKHEILHDINMLQEAGRKFHYQSDDRLFDYLFINNSTAVLTVGTDPHAFYPSWIDSDIIDSNRVLPGQARSAVCYRGRFYWD